MKMIIKMEIMNGKELLDVNDSNNNLVMNIQN